MSLLLAGIGFVQAAVTSIGGAAASEEQVAFVTGDGALTAGLSAQGSLVEFQWPSPGHWGQMTPPNTASWMYWTGTTWTAFASDRWRAHTGYAAPDSLVLTTHFEEIDGGRAADQRIFAWPGRNVLVAEIRLHGFDPSTRVGWMQGFSPKTHSVTGMGGELASGYVPEDAVVAYGGNDTGLLHYRAAESSTEEHRGVRDDATAQYGAAAGVSLATHSFNPILAGGTSRGDGGPLVFDSAMHRGGGIGMIELAPDAAGQALSATVLIGAGTRLVSAMDAVRLARSSSFPALLAAAEGSGHDWLRGAAVLSEQGPLQARTVLNLLLCINRDSGAVLRAPVSRPLLGFASVLDTVFAAAALDELGFTNLAGQTLMHHVDTIRLNSGGRFPPGSIPAQVFSDGRPARFTAAADPASAAWLLAACWRHAVHLPGEAARAFIEPIWVELSTSADYLALAPRPEFAVAGLNLPGEVPADSLDVRYLGLECARRIAEEMLGEAEPGLRVDRRTELYAHIRSRVLNSRDERGTSDPWIARWIASLGPEESNDRGWDPLITDLEVASDPALVPEVPATVPRALRDALVCLTALKR